MSNQPTVLLGSTLNVAAKTVTLPFTPADPELILLVINKTRGATYYDPENPALLGTLSGGNILTFVASTAGHNNADILEVWYAGPWPDDMLSNTIGIQSAVASINGKTPSLDGGKVPVTDTVVQTKLDTIAGKQDAQTGLLTTIEANQLVIGDLSTLATAARQDTGNGYLQSLANDPATGTKQDAQSVLLTAISGKDFSTSAKQDTGNAAIVAVNTSIGTTNTEIGGLTETAPATDTASSGLNGRLQRIAQRITSFIALLPTSLGQKTKANSFAVTLASDQDAIALAAGSAIIGNVRIDQTTPGTTNGVVINDVPAITKGTQGTKGFATQDLKDSGRTAIILSATGTASGTTGTETLITLSKSSGTSAVTTGTSFVITSGKRFRINSVMFGVRGNATATAQETVFKIRFNTAGAVTTGSTIALQYRLGNGTTASQLAQAVIPIPDGFELLGDGTMEIGVSAAAVFTTNAPTWDVLLVGYEY